MTFNTDGIVHAVLKAGAPTDVRTQIELTTYRNWQGLAEALKPFAQSSAHFASIRAFHQPGGKSTSKGKGRIKDKHSFMDKGNGKDQYPSNNQWWKGKGNGDKGAKATMGGN